MEMDFTLQRHLVDSVDREQAKPTNASPQSPTGHVFNFETAMVAFGQEVGYVFLDKNVINEYGTIIRKKKDLQKYIMQEKQRTSINPTQYNTTARSVGNENGKDILYSINELSSEVTIKQIVSAEEIFLILSELHMCKPLLELHEILDHCKLCVIPTPLIRLFWKACQTCNLSLKGMDGPHKPVAEMTVFSLKFCDDKFAHIFMYIERNTNFVLLRPLTAMSGVEVAYELFNIFCDFGTPSYVDCNYHRSFFKDEVLNILKSLDMPCRVPIMFASYKGHKTTLICLQAKQMLEEWMNKSNCTNWAIGAYIVQWLLNSNKLVIDTYIRSKVVNGPIHSPYHALFGILPNTGVLQLKERSLSDTKTVTPDVDKVLINCSQCSLPMYKTFKCHYCCALCHFSCCDRNVQNVAGRLFLMNKCYSCVTGSTRSGEEIILGT